MARTMAALVIRTAVRFRGSQIHSTFNIGFSSGATDYPIIRPVPKPNQTIAGSIAASAIEGLAASGSTERCFIGPLIDRLKHGLRLKIEILPAWLFECLP